MSLALDRWSSVVKLGQSLYREKPGQDKYRPTQSTPIPNFFLAGSYTYQDYLDSMEGATRWRRPPWAAGPLPLPLLTIDR